MSLYCLGIYGDSFVEVSFYEKGQVTFLGNYGHNTWADFRRKYEVIYSILSVDYFSDTVRVTLIKR